MSRPLALSWVLVFLAGCGGNVIVDTGGTAGGSGSTSGTTPGGGSCFAGSGGTGVCTFYTPAQAQQISAQTSCTEGGAIWSDGACPPGGFGTCAFDAYDITYYPGANYTAAQAQAACTGAGGTWS